MEMTATEARELTIKAQVGQVSTPEGKAAFADLMKRVAASAMEGKSSIRSIVKTNLVQELKIRLSHAGFAYEFWTTEPSDISTFTHIWW